MEKLELTAVQPSHSATVSASAGTGKTWLLVSRIIRLLLDGVNPGSILAITFTRKAAAEMQTRLNERLQVMASCELNELESLLNQIDSPVQPHIISKARQLFENVLLNPQPPRITTFHAFCQDLLRRFPFEANVPPGFELVEQTSALEAEAMDVLFNDATCDANGLVAQALETLFDDCSGLANTQLALRNFMRQRSDWWAFTADKAEPVEFAVRYLRRQLDIDENQDLFKDFFSAANLALLQEFSSLLGKNPTKTNIGFVQTVTDALLELDRQRTENAFSLVQGIFLTNDNKSRSRKPSKTLKQLLGVTDETRFIELHDSFCVQIHRILELRAKLANLRLAKAWYQAGHQLLQYYQSLKSEQRVLDFTDLEWNAYLLLTQTQHAAWVQYKLDARIDHILVDEFQDTNPTQWQILLPLLQELAANLPESQRSVFLVGDSKQSIYRFRRAQPELLSIAQQWLSKNLSAQSTTLSWSRRSSPAIIEFVNHVFSSGDLLQRIVTFQPHQTHLKELWGYVTIVPLFDNHSNVDAHTEPSAATTVPFRNPLLEPRPISDDIRHQQEARFIASEITRLIDQAIVVGSGQTARTISYSDIIILLRHRTHAAIYQKALTESEIPYIGIEKGTLLDTLEIRDIVALLSLLTAPFNNLALAQVLKSPIFDFNDGDLTTIVALKDGYWIDRLEQIAIQQPENSKITRAYQLLANWKSHANALPVHDLLDTIFCESNLIERYVAAYPSHLTHRVESNLTRFMELALEIDSGRYPSIGKFLSRLQSLQASDTDAPDELPAGRSEQRVRLLTIHAAKGLEAPVVFLADATNSSSPKDTYQALVKWPANDEAPSCFTIIPKKSHRDTFISQQIEQQQFDQQREETNLFYVAITRARQLLYLTGVQPTNQSESANWYQFVNAQLQHHKADYKIDDNGNWTIARNSMPRPLDITDNTENSPSTVVDPNLSKPFTHLNMLKDIVPSEISPITEISNSIDKNSNYLARHDLQTRGTVLHRMLQLMTEQSNIEQKLLQHNLFFNGELSEQDFTRLWHEAEILTQQHSLSYLFDPTQYEAAFNEVPICYNLPQYHVHGVVDRLVIAGNTVYIVDYKTQMTTNPAVQAEIAGNYIPQMSLYGHGAKLLWPDKDIKAQILFTRNANIVNIALVPVEQAISVAAPNINT